MHGSMLFDENLLSKSGPLTRPLCYSSSPHVSSSFKALQWLPTQTESQKFPKSPDSLINSAFKRASWAQDNYDTLEEQNIILIIILLFSVC